MNHVLDTLKRLKRTNCKQCWIQTLRKLKRSRTAWLYAENHFRTFTYAGKGLEGRQMCSAWIARRQQKLSDTALTLLSKFRKKDFLIKSLQAMKRGFFMVTLNIENHDDQSSSWPWWTFDIDAKAQYPRQESHFALYLVGLERCVVLRVVTIVKQLWQ